MGDGGRVGGEIEVPEDPVDDRRVGEEAEHASRAAAVLADEHVDQVDPSDEFRPRVPASAPRRCGSGDGVTVTVTVTVWRAMSAGMLRWLVGGWRWHHSVA